jgi:MFS family permease
LSNTTIKELGNRLGVNRAVLALSIARMGDAIGNSILIIVLPLYVSQLPAPWFPVPETLRVGILISLFGIVSAILQPVMGGLSDRLGKRKLMIVIGLIVMAFGTLAYVLSTQFVDLLVLRLVQGAGVAITIPASLALMAVSTKKETRGSAMGFFSTLRMVGFATGPLIGGFLYDHFGFNATFFAGTGFILLGLILVLAWVEKDKEIAPTPRQRGFRLIDRDLISAGIVGAGLATFIMASDFSMISTLENQFNARLNQTAFGFGIAFSALMVSRLLFQVPLGRLSDRVGRKPLIIGGLLLMAPATLLLGWVGTTFEFAGMRLVQGLASAAIAAPAFALAADLSKEGGEGRQMSIVTMGFSLGIAVGPLVTGALAIFSFIAPFIIGAIFTILVALIVSRYTPETVDMEQDASASKTPEVRPVEGD